MRIISQMWGRMTKEEKQGYKELSDTDRKRFDIERKLISGVGGGSVSIE